MEVRLAAFFPIFFAVGHRLHDFAVVALAPMCTRHHTHTAGESKPTTTTTEAVVPATDSDQFIFLVHHLSIVVTPRTRATTTGARH